MINTRKLTEALEKRYRLNEDLVDLFLKYHEDDDNFRNNEHGFDEVYKILNKYGDPSEDVDEVFMRAPYSEQEKMVSLIEPQALDESWEEEFDDEYDYIMDDDSLSDNEKARQVKLLRQKYNKKNESLNEDTNKKYIVITRGGFIGGNDLNGTLFDSKEEARAACTEWKKSFGKNRSYYKPQTSIYVYKPGGVFDDAKNYHDERIKDESLTEARNPENDEVNAIIRKHLGKKSKISKKE